MRHTPVNSPYTRS